MDTTANPLYSCFHKLDDPRKATHSSRHLLIDIMMLTILAVICGADTWVAVEKFGHAKEAWLRQFLTLPNGIPSHDTIGDLFARLNAEQLQACFLDWVQTLFSIAKGQIIAIDGKTLRQSYDTAAKRPAIHMISAWSCENQIVLGQVKTDGKSNEITAIPELLNLIDLKGNIITIDAMGCQKKIAKKIIDGGGDYIFNLKGNHATIHDDVKRFIEGSIASNGIQNSKLKSTRKVTGDHGRIETRRYWITNKINWLEERSAWDGLQSVGMVEYESIEKNTGEILVERRFFLTSLPPDEDRFAHAVRQHWSIENGLHWCLDVAFNEDKSRIRQGSSAENLAVIRHIAMNLLKQEKTAKIGIQNKRLLAGWDHKYLAKLLGLRKVD